MTQEQVTLKVTFKGTGEQPVLINEENFGTLHLVEGKGWFFRDMTEYKEFLDKEIDKAASKIVFKYYANDVWVNIGQKEKSLKKGRLSLIHI